MSRLRLMGLLGIVIGGVASAQLRQVEFKTEVILERTAYARGSTVNGVVVAQVDPPYHVNANPASTELKIEAGKGYKVDKIVYPEPKEKAFAFTEGKAIKIYEGRVPIRFRLTLDRAAPKGTLSVKATLRYQACDDNACYPPRTVAVNLRIPIADKDGAVNPKYGEVIKGGAAADAEPSDSGGLVEYRAGAGGLLGQLEESFRTGRWVWFTLCLVVGGLALSLTPGVLPLIPISLGFFCVLSRGQWGRRGGWSAVYARWVAATYAVV
ncbi:MAG: protein-disulfide reductase DsbD family protein, partial [bacterium]|nr:protein-disulfide reductase DsbD family protein [bacterium]